MAPQQSPRFSRQHNDASHFKAQASAKRNKRPLVIGSVAGAVVLVGLAAALMGPLRGRLFNQVDRSAAQSATTATSPESSSASPSAAANAASEAATAASSSDAATQAATPEPQEDTTPLDTSSNAKIATQNVGGISVVAPAGLENTPTMQYLSEVVQGLADKGYKLGFVLEDLASGRTLSYNADQAFYPASSIKVAYCAMVFENNQGSAGMSGTLEQCLVNSSNDAFHDLIDTFGLRSYSAWLSAHGAPNAGQIARVYYYPEISPSELNSCWKEIYRYGKSQEGGAEEFTGYLAQTNHSAMGGLLRSRYTVWSKPGWYPQDGEGHAATADCGVVFSDCGAYTYTVLSNIPEDFSQLTPLLDALNAAHGKMCGGSSALLQTPETTVSGA